MMHIALFLERAELWALHITTLFQNNHMLKHISIISKFLKAQGLSGLSNFLSNKQFHNTFILWIEFLWKTLFGSDSLSARYVLKTVQYALIILWAKPFLHKHCFPITKMAIRQHEIHLDSTSFKLLADPLLKVYSWALTFYITFPFSNSLRRDI